MKKMTDGGPLALRIPPNPSTTCTAPAPPAQPAAPPVQPGPVPQLNWSHFKPEFADKSDKDVEAYLLRTNN